MKEGPKPGKESSMSHLQSGPRRHGAVRPLLLVTAATFLPSCGSDTPTEPTAVNVQVTYISRIPAGCPDQANACYPMCVHGATPASQTIVPLWQADSIRLTATGNGRYEGTLPAVPTNTSLRLLGKDVGMCCFDSCNYPPVLEDILLNGIKLTKVVTDGLPAGVTAALEFKVTGSGTIQG
jgi:hypothetical protein